jgi:hypothetical protein
MLKAKLSLINQSLLSTNHKNISSRLIIPGLLVGALLTGCAGGPTLKAKGAVDPEPEQEEMMEAASEPAEVATEEPSYSMAESDSASVVEEQSDVETSAAEESSPVTSEEIEDATTQMTSSVQPAVETAQKKVEVVTAAAATSVAEATKPKPAAPQLPVEPKPAATAIEPVQEVAEAAPVEAAVSSAIGTRFGIWTLARGENGKCMLTTPTFQVKDGDFTSQFWMDIEQSRFIVNASLTLKSDAQRSGIKFDGGNLITFDTQEMPTRMVINQDVTKNIANGSKLFVYLKSEELGDTILTKEISLKNTSAAVASLKSCK